jgi:hypothetical protein
VAVDDRQIYVSTGASSSRLASEDAVELVMERMRPLLRSDELGVAVTEGVLSLGEVWAGRLKPLPLSRVWLVLTGGMMGFIAFQAWSDARKRRRYALASRRLSALEKAAAEAKAARYAATSCPICMEDFESPAAVGGAERRPKDTPTAHTGTSCTPTGRARTRTPFLPTVEAAAAGPQPHPTVPPHDVGGLGAEP